MLGVTIKPHGCKKVSCPSDVGDLATGIIAESFRILFAQIAFPIVTRKGVVRTPNVSSVAPKVNEDQNRLSAFVPSR